MKPTIRLQRQPLGKKHKHVPVWKTQIGSKKKTLKYINQDNHCVKVRKRLIVPQAIHHKTKLPCRNGRHSPHSHFTQAARRTALKPEGALGDVRRRRGDEK